MTDPSWPQSPTSGPGQGGAPQPHPDPYAIQPYQVQAAPGSTHGPVGSTPPHPAQVVVIASTKSVGVAALLSFVFGPLGMLYSTVAGACVMFAVNVVVALVTFGFGLILTWPACVIWACLAASNHNTRLASRYGVQPRW